MNWFKKRCPVRTAGLPLNGHEGKVFEDYSGALTVRCRCHQADFHHFAGRKKSQPEQVVLLAIGRVTDLHEITLAKEAQPEKIGRVRQGGLVVPLHFYRCQEVAGLMAMAESSRYHG